MPLGSESRQSRNSGNVVQRHSMPASMAAGGMSSARWRLRTTRCLFSSAHGARVKPQLPITTEVMPCQQDEVPSGSQKICASMRSEEHTSELQSPCNLVCRLLLEKKKKTERRQMHCGR